MKQQILIIAGYCLLSHYLVATEHALVQSINYDPVATQQLEALHKTVNELNYPKHKDTLKSLVEKGGDPNPGVGETPLLCTVVSRNDCDLAQLLLARRADPNCKTMTDRVPLSNAKTAQMAQLLVRYKADLNIGCFLGGNLLHDATRNERSAQVIAFLCNAGVDVNLKNTWLESPLHQLMRWTYLPYQCEDLLQRAAPLIWWRANLNSRNEKNQTPLDVLQKECPAMVPQMKALIAVVPEVRREKLEYLNPYPVLRSKITKHPAEIVIDYINLRPGVGYHEDYWSDIALQMKTVDLSQITLSVEVKTQSSSCDSPTSTSSDSMEDPLLDRSSKKKRSKFVCWCFKRRKH